MSPALCPCLNSAQPSMPIIVQLCLLSIICFSTVSQAAACPLPFFFCTVLRPWGQETGILDGSQINLEVAVEPRPEQTPTSVSREKCGPVAPLLLSAGHMVSINLQLRCQ